MQGGYLSYGLLALLAIALLVAAFPALRRRKIDKWLNAAIALVAPLYGGASAMPLASIAWQLGLCVAVFAITALLFAMRQMGGGDVKLLSALALWIAPDQFLKLCVIMAMIGATLSIVSGVRNMEQRSAEALRNRLALAAAGLWVLFSLYALFVVAGGKPLPLGPALAAVAGPQLALWLLPLIMLALVVAAGAGTMHILRRQKKRLPIPYGLAISIAGLWLIAAGQVPAIHSAMPLG